MTKNILICLKERLEGREGEFIDKATRLEEQIMELEKNRNILEVKRAFNIFQVYQYFIIYTLYLTIFHEYLMQQSLKLGVTNYHLK